MTTARELADELHALIRDADPVSAGFYGAVGYDDRLPDVSAPAAAALAAAATAILARCDDVVADSVGDAVTLTAVRHSATSVVTEAEVALVEFSPGPFSEGPSVLVLAASRTVVATEQAAADHLSRARGYAAYLDACGERLVRGTADGRTPPRLLLDQAIGQCDGWLAEDGLGSLGAVEGISPEFSVELAGIVEGEARPALERYRATLASLLPTARPDDACGLVHLPGGAGAYDRYVAVHTTLPLTAHEVHDIGLAACADLRERMTVLAAGLGIDGYLALLVRMREVAAEADPVSAMAAARRAVARAESVAPQWFSPPLPTPCAVEPMDAGMAKAGMPPHYTPPSPDGLRAGTYWFNDEIPGVGGGWDLEAVAYHEAVPGHHLQIARDLLHTDLPTLQTQTSVTATSEGWGLYAELLAGEMGLYSSDEQRLGALGTTMMRAVRLVVDTGLHALGWSYDEAVAFALDHVPMPVAFARAECARYVGMPGQALAYLVGQRELLRLRADATERLGDAFDLKAFHDVLLSHGRVPLPALGVAVDAWIAGAST